MTIPDDISALERAEPHDLAAEQSALGAALISRDALGNVLGQLHPDAYYRPAHGLIHQAMAALAETGLPVDAVTVVAQLMDTGDLVRAGGGPYLHTLVHDTPTAAHADSYIARILDLAQRRALIRAATDIVQSAMTPSDATSSDLAERAVAQVREVRDAGQATADVPVTDLVDFIAAEDEPHDWLIPGLVEHSDRLILTGYEGLGKSALGQQLAVATACGLHPFDASTRLANGPGRVLVLDCENGNAASRRRYRPLVETAAHHGRPLQRHWFGIECRPQGLDLTRPADRSWFMRRVEQVKPQLLLIGPIYRLHAGDPNSEELARKISAVIDEARATANCAVVMEAHSPQGNGFGPRSVRPVGSSLWLRWPEFGYGLRPVEDQKSAEDDRACRFVPWRGARDQRAWPQFLKAGDDFEWPWKPYIPIDADRFTGRSATGAVG